MRPVRIEDPQGPLVPWGTGDDNGLAAHCALEADDERQALVESYERAAYDLLDGYSGRLGRCILRQKWGIPLTTGDGVVGTIFPDAREFKVERRVGNDWSDVAGVSIQEGDGCVALVDLPDDLDGVFLTFFSGWDSADEVPKNLRIAICLHVAHLFDNRSAVSAGQNQVATPHGYESLIAPYISVMG